MCVSSNPNIIITDQPIHQYEWTNKVCTPRRVRHILSASTPTTTTTTTTLRMGTKDTNEEIKTNSDTLGAATGSAASKPRKDSGPCRSYASRFHLPTYGGVSQKKKIIKELIFEWAKQRTQGSVLFAFRVRVPSSSVRKIGKTGK